MADDSEQIVEDYDFHPCNTPRSSKYYNTAVLTNYQQVRLNELKIEKVRENEKYLASHPEIRALVALATRYILQVRPRANLHEHLARFFSQRFEVLQRSVQEYIADQASHAPKEDVWVNKIPEIILNEIIQRTFRSAHDRPQAILNEIIERALNYADSDICDNLICLDTVKKSFSRVSTLADPCCCSLEQ